MLYRFTRKSSHRIAASTGRSREFPAGYLTGRLSIRLLVPLLMETVQPNAASVIQNALGNCPDGQVVFLPAGKYKIMGSLKIGSYVTLRGEGPGHTVLSFEAGGRSGLVMEAGVYYQISTIKNIVALTAGISKGSTTLKVSAATNMNEGDILHIDQLNDGILVDANGVEGICTYCSMGRKQGRQV